MISSPHAKINYVQYRTLYSYRYVRNLVHSFRRSSLGTKLSSLAGARIESLRQEVKSTLLKLPKASIGSYRYSERTFIWLIPQPRYNILDHIRDVRIAGGAFLEEADIVLISL